MHLQQQEALQLQRAERQQQRQQQDEVEDMAEANEKLQQQQQQQQQQQDSLPASPLRAASPSPPHRAPAARSRDDAVAQSAAQRAQLLAGPADAAALRQAISEMRGKVAWLEGQLERALRAREAAEEQMAAAAAERAEERAWHEAQRADRDREVGLLRAKAAALEAAAAAGAGAGSGGGGAARGGGSPGSEALQASVGAEDAALLRAYQQENEAATRRIKDLEQQLSQARAVLVAEAGRLERHFAATQEQERRHGAEAAERLQKLLDAQAALQAAQDAAAEREAELRGQIARLRQEKRELEARAAGVDLRAMEEGDALVAAVRAEMEAMARAHAEQAGAHAIVAALESRLAWFAENQEMIGASDSLIAEQGESSA
ncbi:hypothetical protein MNEG_7531 [Monoraphidium neglectum]|uniref:Centrosomal protein of 162 kDa n=1 Tax=Monoraphidium neglectum TaxID=145388 RepID=A0A0D2N2K9_9CHLO|nr:hypothetical protein MNEG_7531 [Monoraphidium neglectum]KIZ00431.1 hypothetical protein MNEG_7531 [Monoraphidium neglectum]|eukprot:XP_013899450.1 hypothetical protein MNEG_7531 [Monoraphidium neglectum]